jgi:hypothetical protein
MALKRRGRTARLARDPAIVSRAQYFGAAPPPALQDDFPLLAGAAAPPPAPPPLHELLPPEADGSVAPPAGAAPPPQATTEPISIPATADTARAFAMFIAVLSSTLLCERPFATFPGDAAPAR